MTDIEIVNAAIIRCGCAPISTFKDKESSEARTADTQYIGARDHVLAARQWTFAKGRAVLAQAASTPAFKYSYQYIITKEMLSVVRCFSDADGNETVDDWEPEGEYVVTNQAPPLYAEVIMRVPEGRFSPGMVQCLIEYLIHVMAVPLTENRVLSADALKTYREKMTEAAGVDAMQGRTLVPRPVRLPGRRR